MAKIHWLAYIFVGLFVSIFSWRFDYEKFIFFFYAGWAFVFAGIVKLIFNFVKNKAGKKEAANKMHRSHKYCPSCGAAIHLHARFCTRCGTKS
ncbi:zinc-ribbon domain-containing protein [Candidatus Woesearchaeota archaeon]|nr:zinc-ribbon domain-containing protein [Candidatus Woesearchaeota archaeon]